MSCTATTTSYGLKKGATSSRQLDLDDPTPNEHLEAFRRSL